MVMLIPYNLGGTLRFPLIGSATAALSTAASGSLSGTNIMVSVDGGAFASSTNTGTVIGRGWYQVVNTTSEASGKEIVWNIAGIGATLGTIIETQNLICRTYGHASAYYPFDLGTALASQTVGTVTTVIGVASANLIQILGTAVVGTSGTLTNIGTAGTALGTISANLITILSTAVVATQGTFTNIGTVGTALGIASANMVQILGTAVVGTSGTLTNIGTAGTALGVGSANMVQILGTAVVGTSGTLTNIGTAGTSLGVGSANVVQILGTAAVATAGTLTNIGTAGTALGTMSADIVAIAGTAAHATRWSQVLQGVGSGSATAGTLTTINMTTDLSSTVDDYYNGAIVVFIGGTLNLQRTDVLDYIGAAKRINMTTLTVAPLDGQAFVLV